MRKLARHIVTFIGLLVYASMSIIAQVTDSNVASIQVRGSVINPIVLEELTSELIQNPIFIPDSPEQQIIVVDPVTGGGSAGFMVVRGTPGSTFTFQVPNAMRLINSSDGNSFEIEISLSYNDLQDQSSSQLLREQMAEFSLNESGEMYFWIGGTMDVSSLTSGEYSGELIFELEYL